MAKRVTSSRFVGRESELVELRAALDAAAAGKPSLAFVAGESGVGKTRLLVEFERAARADGARVIGGDSVELGEGELPYAPIVAALRPLVRDRDPIFDDIPGSARAELATLLPDLGAAAPGDGDEERGASQRRLFEALLGLLNRLSENQPVVFTLEDIHWADRSTRAFIAFLGGSLCSEHVLAVATYRSDELHRRHPLRPLLAELESDGRTRRIELSPFERDELALIVEDITGEPAAGTTVDRVYGRSEGNPLFTEELLAADPGGHAPLPPTLRDALMVRVERIHAESQEVLRVLAAAGRSDHSLLAEATGFDARSLRQALRESVSGHIVVADEEGRYSFRHALLREVVYEDLLPGERADIHLSLARVLERRSQEDGGVWIATAISHHYRAAGDQPAALRASVHAAAEAERVHAHGEAAALLEKSLELWERVPDPEAVAGADHVELLLRAARAHRVQPDDSRALPLYEKALEELDADSEPVRYAGVLGELAGSHWSSGRGDESRDTLERALALVPDDHPTPERARLLAEQMRFLMLRGRYRETIEAADEALAAAEAACVPAVRGQILNRLGTSLFAVGEMEKGEHKLHEAIELARERGTVDDVATAYSNLADALHHIGHASR